MTDTKPWALITGSTSDIGAAICTALEDNWNLILHTHSQTNVAEELSQHLNTESVVWQANLSDLESLPASLKGLLASIPEKRIEGFVHNAAINTNGLLLRSGLKKVQNVFELNLLAAYELTHLCIRGMVQANFGRILYIGSTASHAGNAGQAAYCASKAGLEGLARSTAREYGAKNITANVLAPGWIRTSMSQSVLDSDPEKIVQDIPLGRIGRPEDLSQWVKNFMAKDCYTTGQSLMVNGGLYM